jgi:hypothetical protein
LELIFGGFAMEYKCKVKIIGLVLLMSVVLVVACGRPESETAATDVPEEGTDMIYEEYEDEELDETQENQEVTNGEPEESTNDSSHEEAPQEEGSVSIPIYQSNEEGDGLISRDETIEYLTAENVLGALIDHGELSSGIRVLNFSESSVNGQRLIELDLSREFNDFIAAQGSWGEFVVIGSVVNTFLSAFSAESIIITVGGNPLATPHMGELAEPMGRFDIF